ncbi:putative RNA methyltransferase [Opacimonas sp. LMIT016]|uniref:putative RNA methyltransferase n=2 Tax=Alteromonadaceae TaxID=72275 RepID=UPI003AAD6865
MFSSLPSTMLSSIHNQWLCPACHLPLSQKDRTLGCDNQHQFDLAKQGYVNLHLVQHKKSKQPGDSPEMVTARRTFLSQGHYAPLAQCLSQIITLYQPNDALRLFDAGCGEGYYLSTLHDLIKNTYPNSAYCGIDIAKSAVAKAAKRLPQAHFAVASTFAIPLAECSQSVVIQIFAPSSESEIRRVLEDDGIWITVNPAPEHLYELKECVYDAPSRHEVDDDCPAGFEILDNQELYFAIDVQKHEDTRQALLQMTPFYWSISEAKRALLSEKLTTAHAHFHIKVLRKMAI